MANPDDSRKKGSFSPLKLPVSKKYIYPITRRRMITIGAFGCVAFALYFTADTLLLNDSLVSSGPLSSHHANLETNCAACHQSFGDVASDKCSACHDITGDRGRVFDFSAHYIYRSGNLERRNLAHEEYGNREQACYACHVEHLGRNAQITLVPDARCKSCHGFGSFNNGHPEFAFARNKTPDDGNLIFSHISHATEYAKSKDIQQNCLTCHQYQSDGQHFKPIDFDQHCAQCHSRDLGGFRHKDTGALSTFKNKCAMCHSISRGKIEPVQQEQRVFTKAEFNHQAHTLVQPCLGCHTEIPITRDMPGSPISDQSTTLNIPKIASCESCHNSNLTSNDCATCHEFHPNKQLRFTLTKVN
jgi:c(7)-type cytochrome triheme protein